MPTASPSSLPAARAVSPKRRIIIETLDEATQKARNLDVMEHFYSTVRRPYGKQFSTRNVTSKSILDDLAEQAALVGLRLDFMHGDLCYFMVHGKQP